MVSLFTSYEIDNDADFQKSIFDSLKVVDNLSFAFGQIARDFFKSNTAIFSLKNEGKYPSLKEKYQKVKDAKYGRQPILVASGKLRDSLTKKPNSDSIKNIGRKTLVLGTKVKYGIYHQSDAPRTKIPLRKFLFIGPEAPKFAPSRVTGRLQRWLAIIDTDVSRRLAKV